MKRLFILLLLIAFGCETPTKKKEEKPVIVKEPVKEVILEKKIEKVDNTLFSLERKPCSGDCPVFSVTVTKDQVLTYHGKEYTNIEGVHTVSLSTAQFEQFNKLLEDARFSELSSHYTTSGTKDFAESVLKYSGKEVTVRLWKDAPKELTAVYVFVEDILYNQNYLQ
jgi:hypothetical protein